MTLVMGVSYLLGKNAIDRRTDMDGPTRCSSLTLEREEYLITVQKATKRNLKLRIMTNI
jgi:hypothetical protein